LHLWQYKVDKKNFRQTEKTRNDIKAIEKHRHYSF